MSVYRATIDNDMYKKEDWMNKYFIQKPCEQTEYFRYHEKEDCVTVEIGKYFGCYNQSWGFICDYEYRVYYLRSHLKVTLRRKDCAEWERRTRISPAYWSSDEKGNRELQNAMWYGRGFGESGVDSKEAAFMGIYKSSVDGMMTNYVYPQENGHREDVKWFSIGDGKNAMLMHDGSTARIESVQLYGRESGKSRPCMADGESRECDYSSRLQTFRTRKQQLRRRAD